MNGFRNSVLWPADRFVFTDGDFASSMVTDRPETFQLEKTTATGTEHLSLSSALAAKPSNPKQSTGSNGYIHVEKISSLTSNSQSVRGHSQEGNTLHLVWY
jgi:hypothetical protein